MGSPQTANLAVKGITKPPNPESKNARKPRPTHGFLAKSNTCSRQITATDQSLPNSSRATSVDPGFEVDLYVRAALRNMTSVWMGVSTLKVEIEAGNIELTGDKALARSMHNWLGLSAFAKEKSRIKR